ncbi:hypothetical protein [Dietzia sp. WMMA184]|uniref:hypothetical protein n=1 Tax=Dietzia sp. WMMA184 TaxID=2039808 RepID=UPI000BDE8E5C|nr:hypothetical protein [Dietzia sp. WMMA184]
MASPEQRAQFELLAPLLAREGVDVWTASVADLDAGMERAKQRHAAAVARVRAVLDAHARADISAAGAVRDRARVADAPEGMAELCEAVLLDCDAATGIRTVVRKHGPASALYAAAAMTAAVFSRWAAHTGDSMAEVIAAHA